MCEQLFMGPHLGRFVGFGPLEGLFGLLLLGLIVAGVVLLIVNPGRSGRTQTATAYVTPSTRDPAVETVRMRYARGEISREEYAAVAADLEGRPPQATS